MVKQLEFESVFFIFLGALVGAFLLTYTRNTPVQFHSDAADINAIAEPTQTPTPTVAFVPTTTSASQISSDGTKKVVVNTTQNKDKTQTYTVSVDDGPTIYTGTLGSDETVTIPRNTWSSTNNYFFIQEQTNAEPKVLVFRATGEPFANGQQYLDLMDTFLKRTDGSGNTFDQATGWAEGNLIVINTKRSDETQGASYWYEVPDGAIIPLSTKF